MTIEKAVEVLSLAKHAVMMAAYKGDLNGIDGALPQEYVTRKGMSYGAANPDQNIFWFVVEYRNGSCFVRDLRTILTDDQKDAFIACAIMYSFAERKLIKGESLARAYTALKQSVYK